MKKIKNNFTLEETVKMSIDFGRIVHDLTYLDGRQDVDEYDVSVWSQAKRAKNLFKKKYGHEIFDKYFKKELKRLNLYDNYS